MADMEFAFVFTGDASDLKAAGADAKAAVSSVSDEAVRSATDINAHAAALEKEASAARKAAGANTENATATKRAREEAAKAAGAVPSSTTPASRRLPPQMPQSNDNVRAVQYRRQNLMYQAFDIGQTAAMGMNPAMIMAQQGPQIAQLYAGQGGATAALEDFRTLAGGALRLVTPLTVGIGAVATATAIGIKAYSDYLASIKEVEIAAAGFGRAVAGTAVEMEAAAQSGAAAAGITVSSARSMQAQFLRSAKIGSEHYESLIAISKDFAATVGMDATAAGAALTEMFSDPAKAAQTLNRQYGLLDAATTRRIADLSAQNRLSEAQGVLLEALPDKLADAERATTALGRAWNWVGTAASNALDGIGSFLDRRISGPSIEEQIASAEEAQRRLSSGWGVFDLLNPGRAEQNTDALRLDELRAEKARRDEDDIRRREEAARNQREAVAMGLAEGSGANAAISRRRALENSIASMRSGLNPDSDDIAGQQMLTVAIEAQERVLDALVNSKARNAEMDRLDIQIANERNPLLRAELEARRTRLQLTDQEVSSEKIAEEAARARNRVIAETIGTAGSQLVDLRDELEVRQRLAAQVASGSITQTDANRLLSEELTLRPLIAAAVAAEGEEKQQLQAVISGLRDTYAALAAVQQDEAAQSIIRGQAEKLEQLRVEAALVGQSDEVRRRSLALLEAEQQIRKEGISSESVRAAQIRKGALAVADYTAEVERLRDAWSEVQSAAEGAIDGAVDKLVDGDFSGALESIKDELVGGITKLAITNPLKNGLLGTNYGTASDLGGIGGIIGRLFGGAADPSSIVSSAMQSVGSMAVNAGTVVINGSAVGGGLSNVGRMFSAANGNAGSVGTTGSAVDLMSSLLGATESSDGRSINSFLAAGGVNIDAARTAWCAGFVNSALEQIGVKGSGSLFANSFQNWGAQIDPSQLLRGDVLLQTRGGRATAPGGHVGLATGATRSLGGVSQLQMISGNSGSSVATTWVNSADVQVRRATEGLAGLTSQTGIASQGLGALGTGFDKFGSALSNMSTGSSSGGGGLSGWLGKLFGGAASSTQWAAAASGSLQPGLFSTGGYTGAGGVYEPRGIVHAGEVVFSQADVARHGGVTNVEILRTGRRLGGYASGGPVGVMALPAAAVAPANSNSAGGNVSIAVNNYSGQQVRQEESRDQNGNRQVTMTIGDQVAGALQQRGNKARRAMTDEFGVRPRGVAR